VTLPRLGITTSFVDPSDASNFAKRQRKYEGVFAESLGNQNFGFEQFRQKPKLKVPFIVDNTVPSPYLLNPINMVLIL
jgi:O-acetylhomoserine (thiol)-lyase